MTSPSRCLVVGPSWVGDMVMAQSLFILLRRQHPAMRLEVLAPAWSQGVLERMAQVDRVAVSPFAHGQLDWAGRRRLAAELREQAYDLAIVLPNSWKSALVPFLAGIPRRVGYRGEWRYGLLSDVRRLDKAAHPRLVERYLALGLPPGADLPPPPWPELHVDLEAVAALLARFGLDPARPLLALCPGAEYGSAKRWPAAHFAAVARDRLAAGWQVCLCGSAKDRPVTAAVNGLCAGQARDLAGETRLEEVTDLLAAARAVVSNDSGLMHLAAAVGTPLVALFGSSDPGYTPPLAGQARVLSLDLPCRPCFARECRYGHTACLNDIPPARVLEALAGMQDG